MTRDPTSPQPDSPRDEFQTFASKVRSNKPDTALGGPLPTPEILNISRREGVWQHYLAYLIDPNAAHGFDNQFLDAFLVACESVGAFDTELLHRNRSRVNVEVEVPTEHGRRPDVLIYDSDRWFVLLELKVDSEEGEAQTKDYANAEQLGPLNVSNFASEASFFGFIAPTIPGDIDDRFQGILWRTITDAFTDARNDITLSEFPLRSIAQLDDFITTLQQDMTDVDEHTKELARLFFEYRDEIEAAKAAVGDVVEGQLQHEWVTVLTEPDSQPNYWDDSWHFPATGSGYGTFGRHEWNSSDGVKIYFEHRPTKENFCAGDFEFELAIRASSEEREGGDPRKPFCEQFVRLLEQSDTELPASTTVSTDTSDLSPGHFLVKAYYTYDPGSVEGYYEALEQAAADHEDLVPIVNQLF